MKQAAFALLLVFASFAGGALVNGPGLDWVRQQIQSSPAPDDPLDDDLAPEDSSSLVSSPPVSAPPAPVVATPAEQGTGPMAPPPPFQLGQPPAAAPPATATLPPPAPPGPDNPIPEVAAPRGPTLLASPPVRPVSNPGPTEPAQTAQPSQAQAQAQAGEPWPDAPDSAAPAQAALPVVPDPAAPPALAVGAGAPVDSDLSRAATAPADSWDELVRQMKAQGVQRYWVEGAPDAPVRFRCVVPLVGDEVVSQHFEAEGATAAEAARATLRRVALWRASHAP